MDDASIVQCGIVPVILAAGDSVRMGYPKALLPLGSGTFLTAILDSLIQAGLSRPIVVLGRDAQRIAPLVERRRLTVLINADPGRGQLSSLRLALTAIEPGNRGCLVWPVDQPRIPAGVVRNLVELCLDRDAPLGMPVCDGRRGHPAFFHRSLFPELCDLPAGLGAREVVLRHLDRAILLGTENRTVIEDIDTPENYRCLTGETIQQALARCSIYRPK